MRLESEIRALENCPIEYRCPRCKGPLQTLVAAYTCDYCSHRYPVLLGIPDFRVFPDPYIEYADDWEKAHRISDQYPRTDFRGLVEYYWSITPNTPRDLAQRFLRYVVTAVERGRRSLDTIRHDFPEVFLGPGHRFLEVGCGTGGFLVAASGQFANVVGVDIAFRWLVVAKKRLEEAGVSAQLVCCCAEHLPFPDSLFDVVIASDVLEHTPFQKELIQETHRALRPGGVFFASTPNRFSLSPEPHVRVRWVGWFPRFLMKTFVRLVRGISYEHIRLLSAGELKRLVRRSPFQKCQIRLPFFCREEQEGLSVRERRLIAVYNRIKDWPIVSSTLRRVGPVLQLVCRRAA